MRYIVTVIALMLLVSCMLGSLAFWAQDSGFGSKVDIVNNHPNGFETIRRVPSFNYTKHKPIFIDGNSAFNATNGVTHGNGTVLSPFIIENWEIPYNNSNKSQVDIQNTDAFFTIRNCYIRDGNGSIGISFYKVVNGKIEDNYITGNCYRGIYIYLSSNNIIINNTVTGTQCGIWVHTDSDCNYISRNDVYQNTYDGIILGQLKNNTVDNNNIESNNYGLLVHYAIKNVIIYNKFKNNFKEAIEVNEASAGNRIHHNDFLGNNLGGSRQVIDNCYNNYWNTTSGGNHWSDWTSPDTDGNGIVDKPYIINKTARIADFFPLVIPVMGSNYNIIDDLNTIDVVLSQSPSDYAVADTKTELHEPV